MFWIIYIIGTIVTFIGCTFVAAAVAKSEKEMINDDTQGYIAMTSLFWPIAWSVALMGLVVIGLCQLIYASIPIFLFRCLNRRKAKKENDIVFVKNKDE